MKLFLTFSRAPTYFFLFYLLTGLFIFKDYGISWDEDVSRMNGLVNVKYISEFFPLKSPLPEDATHPIPRLDDYLEKDHTCFFEVFLVVAEFLRKAIQGNYTLEDSGDVYQFRHFLTFLFSWLGAIYFFKLCRLYFNSTAFALLGCLLLVLSPRIFAEGFYNSKDIVLMYFFIITTYLAVKFFKQPTLKNCIQFAILSGCLASIRVNAIILPAISLVFMLIGACFRRYRWSVMGRFLLIYLAVTLVFTVICWPFLWKAPLSNFLFAFQNMSKFRWGSYVLFMAQNILATDLPAIYLPVWIGITTPPLIVLGFIGGTLVVVWQFFKSLLTLRLPQYFQSEAFFDSYILSLWVAPVAAVVVLHSVVYDAWRHLYFTYPFFVLIALVFFQKIWFALDVNEYHKTLVAKCFLFFKTQDSIGYINKFSKRIKVLCQSVAVLFVLFYSIWLVNNHSFQNVYFNIFADKPQTRYELDYWGQSTHKLYELIVKNDARSDIKVFSFTFPGVKNLLMLPAKDRERIKIVNDKNDADYLISHLRTSSHILQQMLTHQNEYAHELYSISVDKEIKIGVVYKNK